MQYLLYLLSIPFLYVNYKIIRSDLKFKIIPNKYLSYLLILIPFYYIYIYISFTEINYLMFLLQIFLTFIISFILYYFWIWAAWDAKYLLVLSLFIPYTWIIPFTWNIAIITLVYLILYFIWFYFWKCIVYKGYAKSLWKQILNDLKEKWIFYKENKKWNNFFIILKWLVIFIIIFVSIRLARIYLFNEVFENSNNFSLLKNLIDNYSTYIILAMIIIFIWLIYLSIFIINEVKNNIVSILNIKVELVWNIFIFLLFIWLSSFIMWEYKINSEEIIESLFRIFSLYLIIYIIFKILLYSYKITFWIAETNHINIEDLKEWDIVDKQFLIKMFWEQSSLWYADTPQEKQERKNLILFPDPKKYFKNIDRTITKEDSKIIKECYKIVNNWHKKEKTKWYNQIKQIKTLNTFPFAGYILWWFIITFILGNKIFKYIVSYFLDIIKSFY